MESPNQPEAADVPPELAARLVGGEINLAQFAGLERPTLYAIARLGYQLLESGKPDQAREIYRGLVAADPYDSVFHCHLAAAHQRLGELDEAFAEYTQALRFNVGNAEALAGRGEIHLERGQISEAIKDLSAAVRLDPSGKKNTTLRAGAILVGLKEAVDKRQK
jgi:tetratricopeptide (TPR) repeat protein